MKRLAAVCFAMAALVACASDEAPQAVPVAVLPDAPDPTPFTRAYSLTESLDGAVRVFAKEAGDRTHLYQMRAGPDGWRAPERLELPARKTLMGPSFSFEDGALYYASDTPYPGREGRADLNIWRVTWDGEGFGTPEPLGPQINTGANETKAAVAQTGEMVLVTNHSRASAAGQGGGYDLMFAWRDDDGVWVPQQMPAGVNDRLTDDHVTIAPDASWFVFYSHRAPKLGVVDLWISRKQDDGTWGAPTNLGAPVNTPGIDFGAGLSSDGQTLFFSRDGRLMEIALEAAFSGDGRGVPGPPD